MVAFEVGKPAEQSAGDAEGWAPMRVVLNVVGGLLTLMGIIWFLQGINVLPGSFMTGQIRWAVYGGIAIAVGVATMFTVSRRL